MLDWFVLLAPLLLLPVILLAGFVGCSAIVGPGGHIRAEVPIHVVFDSSGGTEPFLVELSIVPVLDWSGGDSLPDPLLLHEDRRSERLDDGRDRYELRTVLQDRISYEVTAQVFDDRPVSEPFLPPVSCLFSVAIGRDGLPLPVSFESRPGERRLRPSGCREMG